ncbi:MAG: hypothetical protein V3S02_05760, partial [Dehalococcoidales bacterium]
VVSELPTDALTRLNTGINGDERTANNPVITADFVKKSRLVNPLFLPKTHPFLIKSQKLLPV